MEQCDRCKEYLPGIFNELCPTCRLLFIEELVYWGDLEEAKILAMSEVARSVGQRRKAYLILYNRINNTLYGGVAEE